MKYFEHDKFITAEEFMTLDEKLMVSVTFFPSFPVLLCF